MAITVNVAGLATIKAGTGASGALESLGYTMDGARITSEGYTTNVPGDQNGGDEGPPVEIQYLGETARVRLEMTKWDTAVQAKLEARFKGGTAGTPPTAGSLMFAGGGYFRLLIHSPATPRNFICASLLKQPIEINKGTKFSRLVLEFECYKDPTTGVLYNSTIT